MPTLDILHSTEPLSYDALVLIRDMIVPVTVLSFQTLRLPTLFIFILINGIPGTRSLIVQYSRNSSKIGTLLSSF